jgi:hypothetical protein
VSNAHAHRPRHRHAWCSSSSSRRGWSERENGICACVPLSPALCTPCGCACNGCVCGRMCACVCVRVRVPPSFPPPLFWPTPCGGVCAMTSPTFPPTPASLCVWAHTARSGVGHAILLLCIPRPPPPQPTLFRRRPCPCCCRCCCCCRGWPVRWHSFILHVARR